MVKRSQMKSRKIAGAQRNRLVPQMCAIHKYFKQFNRIKAKVFRLLRKLSSIICAKHLSSMCTNAAPVISD
jgi:hypothetical protein